MRPSVRVATACIALSLAGCAGFGGLKGTGGKQPAVATSSAPSEAEVVSGHLNLMNRMGSGTAAEQTGIADAARQAYLDTPSPTTQLAYACVLATPGHARSDPAGARTVLGALLGAPEQLRPAELKLAQVVFREVESRLSLESELRELRAATANADQEREAVTNRRLQAQIAENARLRKELDEALAKLEAVAELERNLVNRQSPAGDRP